MAGLLTWPRRRAASLIPWGPAPHPLWTRMTPGPAVYGPWPSFAPSGATWWPVVGSLPGHALCVARLYRPHLLSFTSRVFRISPALTSRSTTSVFDGVQVLDHCVIMAKVCVCDPVPVPAVFRILIDIVCLCAIIHIQMPVWQFRKACVLLCFHDLTCRTANQLIMLLSWATLQSFSMNVE